MHVREAGHEVAREFARSTYAQVLADVPPALFPYWAQTSQQEFPSIPRDASFFAQSAEGLMMFFDCAAAARKTCALPSRAADSVWHAWMRMDEVGLHRFCIRHFGKIIPHVERAKMGADMNKALAVCLVQARRRASQPVAGPYLPRLFSLDAQLGMPGGFGYGIVSGMIACSTLDELGMPGSDLRFPRDLSPRGLLDAGLVGKDDFRKATGVAAPEPFVAPDCFHGGFWLASDSDSRCESDIDSDIDSDSSCDSETGSGCDSASADGGSSGDGGSACGSGCGGGD